MNVLSQLLLESSKSSPNYQVRQFRFSSFTQWVGQEEKGTVEWDQPQLLASWKPPEAADRTNIKWTAQRHYECIEGKAQACGGVVEANWKVSSKILFVTDFFRSGNLATPSRRSRLNNESNERKIEGLKCLSLILQVSNIFSSVYLFFLDWSTILSQWDGPAKQRSGC